MLFIQPYIHAYAKKAEKLGKVMTRRVANKQRKHDPLSRIKNTTPFSL